MTDLGKDRMSDIYKVSRLPLTEWDCSQGSLLFSVLRESFVPSAWPHTLGLSDCLYDRWNRTGRAVALKVRSALTPAAGKGKLGEVFVILNSTKDYYHIGSSHKE